MRLLLLFFLLFSTLYAQLFPNLGVQRAGISALTFLKINISPRSAALGENTVTLNPDGYAWFTNPAAASLIYQGPAFAISHTFWFVAIQYAFASGIIPLKNDAAIGGYVAGLSSGKMEKRTVFQPQGTGEYFYATYVTAAFAYSKKLSDRFSYGLALKYINETLDQFVAHTAVMDVGFLYRLSFKDIRFGVMLYNFGPNSRLRPKKEVNLPLRQNPITLESFPPPTLFALGFSITPWKKDKSALRLFAQLNHPNDNPESYHIGLEYMHRSVLFFRVGYKINVADQPYPVAGMGIKTRIGRHPLFIDYGFMPHRYLGSVHRVGAYLQMNLEKRQ